MEWARDLAGFHQRRGFRAETVAVDVAVAVAVDVAFDVVFDVGPR